MTQTQHSPRHQLLPGFWWKSYDIFPSLAFRMVPTPKCEMTWAPSKHQLGTGHAPFRPVFVLCGWNPFSSKKEHIVWAPLRIGPSTWSCLFVSCWNPQLLTEITALSRHEHHCPVEFKSEVELKRSLSLTSPLHNSLQNHHTFIVPAHFEHTSGHHHHQHLLKRREATHVACVYARQQSQLQEPTLEISKGRTGPLYSVPISW